MISITTKTKIFNRLKYFYTSTYFNISGLETTFNKDYNDAKDFETILYKENTRMFFRYAVTLKATDFLNCIKNEYRLFSIFSTSIENINWLQHTYNFIININELSGFISKSDTVAFLDWYDTVKIEPEKKSVEKYKPFYRQRQFTDCVNIMNADKTQNIHYLPTLFYDWKVSINKTVDENTTLTKKVQELLKTYNWNVYDLMNKVIQLYKGVNKNDNNTIHIQEGKIEFRLSSIIYFAEIVEHYERKDEFIIANKIKKHCLSVLKNAIENLKEIYSIDIFKTPLKTDIEAVNEALKNSINIDEVIKLQGLNNEIKPRQQNTGQKTVLNFVHNVSDKENFIKDLTTAFNKDEDRGRTIKAVINFLKEAGIFIIPDRQLKTFLNLLQVEFTQNIGSYTSINDAEKKNRFDDQFLNPIKIILKPLIDNHRK
jgi:hypothetical protein